MALLWTGVGALGNVLAVEEDEVNWGGDVVSIGKSKLFWLTVDESVSFGCLALDGGGAGACFLLFCFGLVELELLFLFSIF